MVATSVSKIEGYDEVQEMLKEYREGGALELKQYKEIGTIEECRNAREKQIPMPPEYDKGTNTLNCPVCGDYLQHFVDDDSLNGVIPHYCNNCGQKIKETL